MTPACKVLKSNKIEILQLNLGYLCNQKCNHCHVNAGPERREVMSKEIMQHCLNALDNSDVNVVDLTGGAPEMNPNFQWFVKELSSRNVEIIVRSNLTILVANKTFEKYPDFFKEHQVTVIASLPCYTSGNTDRQRGDGVFVKSLKAIKKLNDIGYGKLNSDLKLHLVYNPGGAFLPSNQKSLEADYKKRLKKEFNIVFNNLYTITNLPINRFLDYLLKSNKYEDYLQLLVGSFNLNALKNVMCKNTLSVGYDGRLYDCDFNQMLNLGIATKKMGHIADFEEEKLNSRDIVINNHCYGCTAGFGSSCQGATVS